MPSFLQTLALSEEEFSKLYWTNSALRSICVGYAAEHHAMNALLSHPDVTKVEKMSDSDRSHRYDFRITYKGEDFRLEMKCVSKTGTIGTRFHDMRVIDGVRVGERERDSFDVLGACSFCQNGEFQFQYALESELPCSTNPRLPKEMHHKLLKGSIKVCDITLVNSPFELFDRLISQRQTA